MKRAKLTAFAAMAAASALLISGCSDGGNTDNGGGNAVADLGADGCTPVVVATSSEKVNLMEELGLAFKESQESKGLENCASIYPINVASGDATEILSQNPAAWPELTEDYWPTVWSPASTIWSDRVAAGGNPQLVEGAESFTKTPVVFGVPESMANALGYPENEISYKDLEGYIADPAGWGALGKPLWGSFKIAKTNPNTSTTGLSVILTQAYANAGKSADLTVDDVNAAEEFSRTFESGAIHYGDTTGKVLQTLYDNSEKGSEGSSYVSAIALEETSLFNYNLGNPDSHTVQPGETLKPPKEKLIAVYPEEGSMWSDNPATVLGSPWVTPEKKAAGDAFLKFLQTPAAQEILPKYGFRPLDDSIDTSEYLNATVGIDPARPTVSLPKPEANVVSTAIDQWANVRKPSAVLELIDISNSMRVDIGDGRTRLDGAIEGAKSTLSNFRSTDEVGVWAFTTDIRSDIGENIVPVRDFGPLGGDKENIASSIDELSLAKTKGTPLYDSVAVAYDYMLEQAEEGRINAIIVLSDGDDESSKISLDSLLVKINSSAQEGGSNAPVRIFTIAYGAEANTEELKRISAASGGQMFDATDPKRIEKVFQQVINNF